MIFGEIGQVTNDLHVLGLSWTPSYLLCGLKPVLFEAGFSCLGKLYVDDAKRILKDRPPEMLFLTHVHYDHCGAVSYFKKNFPSIRIAASSRAAEIIQRPNAQKLIKELSEKVILCVAKVPGIHVEDLLYEPFEPFNVDIVLENGQVIQISDELSVRVMAVPGHTRDLLAYYIPERKTLFATESVGNLDRIGQVNTEFLVDYELYLKNIRFICNYLEVNVLCLGHQFVISGVDVATFLSRSMNAAEHFKKRIEDLLFEESGNLDQVEMRMKAEEYDINPGPKQLEKEYLINLTARVKHLASAFVKCNVQGIATQK